MNSIIEHQLWLYSAGGVPLTVINDGSFSGINWGLRDIEAGVLELVLPGDFDRSLLQIDGQIEIHRAVGYGQMKREGDTAFFIRRAIPSTDTNGVKTIAVTAYSAFELIDRRIVAYDAGTAYTSKSGILWPNFMRAIMRENYGSLATDTERNLSPWLTIEADTAWGTNYTKGFSWRKVLNVLKDIVNDIRSTGVYCTFDVVRTTAPYFEFRVYLGPRGTDHRQGTAAPVIISEDNKTLLSPSVDNDWVTESNFIYGLGPGVETTRIIKTARDDARIGVSPFNRREYGAEARNTDATDAAVQAEANAALEAQRPKRKFKGIISQTEGCLYGVHWTWGDIVTAEYDGDTFDCYVDAVNVTVNENGTEVATGILRSVADVQ
jgi:hypothetical protein